ncbi:TonB-dependent receptor [Sphingomonas sp.]|uniref:TonB-dependent receptor plug domain-containing protein n=1 Tax=Sphingomonas sp. TaxID=28214 RepID=UPI002CF8B874|nr:TonB-dependent receptor [Sphingomonas sp.]HWK36733.1 TonB-dependent receptor [Sphingomonas sp.]
MRKLRKAAFLAAAAAPLVMASPVWAQDASGDGGATQDNPEIVITGSRLPSGDLTGPAPLTILDSAEINRTGRTSIGELLRELPVASAAASDSAGRGNDGSANIALRGLSAVNTLVLLNGRRMLSNSAGGTVDLNSIPFDMIDRVEVLQDGASAVYGSDAISGVVNSILRRDYDGVLLKAGSGVSSRGDLPNYELSGTFGMKGSRGGFIVNASYRESGGNVIGDRPVSLDPDWRSMGGRNYRDSAPTTSTAFKGLDPSRPNAILILKDGATGYSSLSDYRDARFPGALTADDGLAANDGVNYWAYESSASAIRQINVSANGHYELTSGIEAFVEAGYSTRHSLGFLAPDYYDGTVTVGAASPTNPFGRDLTVYRTFVEEGLGNSRRNEVDAKLYRIVAGLEGKVGSWNWDVSANVQHLDQYTNSGFGIVQSRFQLAIDDPTRKFYLNTTCAQTAGCVPINLFGPAGSITEAQLASVSAQHWRDVNADLRSFVANIAGPLFKLPYGTVNIAVGAEYREESYEQFQDNAADYTTQTPPFLPPTRKVKEVYGEVGLPLLKDIPLVYSLDVEAAVRYSDYDAFGSTTNPKVGVKWKPIRDLLIRGSWGTGFRAPNFTEANSTQTRGYRPLTDPCQGAGYASLAGCHGTQSPVVTGAWVVAGGNPNLRPETADTLTVGAVFTPSFVPRLSLTVDFFRIKKADIIGIPDPDYIIAQNAAGVSGFETLVTRNPDNSLYEVFAGRANLLDQKIKGIDIGVNYRMDLGSAGKLDLRGDVTYTDSYKLSPAPNQPAVERVGTFTTALGTIPRYKATGRATWTIGPFTTTYGMRYVGPVRNDASLLVNGARLRAEDYIQHDIALMYDWEAQKARMTLGVENVGDAMPPWLEGNYYNGFDNLTFNSRGRFFYVRLQKGF